MNSKSSDGNEGKVGKHLPALMDPRLPKALDHVLRQHILLAAVQGEVSPNVLSKELGEGLSQVSYHVKVLRELEMIKMVRTEPRRGAVEHYYRASAKTLLPAKAWRRLKKELRAVVGAGQASDLFRDLTEALKAGRLQGAHDHIVRTPLVLDAEGQCNVKEIAERATREVEDEQRAVAKRVDQGDDETTAAYTFALLAFEAAGKPADSHSLVARVKGAGVASTNGATGADRNGGGDKRGRRKAGAAGR